MFFFFSRPSLGLSEFHSVDNGEHSPNIYRGITMLSGLCANPQQMLYKAFIKEFFDIDRL